ncbi:putative aldose 1-epimerase [Teratosphaeria destructans]|uniref:Aldose 1-epimerase n=1 Tax=Teratosphaeria destructans TaxID=418781 RepID=A0A9W7SKZ8_9PEZI|nr:putative aldose 1-epimerase [Teratosphaeria destructans]
MANVTASDAFTFLPQGAIIQEFKVGGKNIVLGFPSAATYKIPGVSPYFGETIGRVANRISDAKIKDLNGKSYTLAANNGPNTLHGGSQGWGKKDFNGPTPVKKNGKDAILYKYLSKDGEEGFPGTVQLSLWYTPSIEKEQDVEKTSLEIEYEVELVGDEVEETAVALTNHSYFNLSDGPTIEGTIVNVSSNLHQVTDDTSIPTGEIKPFQGIPTNEDFTLGPQAPDPDHCFIVNNDPSTVSIDTRSSPLKRLISLSHPKTKLYLEAFSTEPAFQFYAGRFIDVPAVDGQPALGRRSGMCIEASRYVNAVNDEKLRHMVILKRGQKYGSRTIYRAWQA